MLGAYAYGNSTGMGRLLKNAAGWLAAGKGAGIRLGWHDTLTKQLVLSLVQQVRRYGTRHLECRDCNTCASTLQRLACCSMLPCHSCPATDSQC